MDCAAAPHGRTQASAAAATIGRYPDMTLLLVSARQIPCCRRLDERCGPPDSDAVAVPRLIQRLVRARGFVVAGRRRTHDGALVGAVRGFRIALALAGGA